VFINNRFGWMIIYDFIYDLLQRDKTFKAAADQTNPKHVSLMTISSYVMYFLAIALFIFNFS